MEVIKPKAMRKAGRATLPLREITFNSREDVGMTKAELITKVSVKEKIPLKVAKVIVDTMFDGMLQSLQMGERIEIRGFGAFTLRHYRGYKGRNPKTGEIVSVPPKKLPFFKVGKELKEMVNGGIVRKVQPGSSDVKNET